jgi:hypothetical protein
MKHQLCLHLGAALLTVLGSIGCWAGAAPQSALKGNSPAGAAPPGSGGAAQQTASWDKNLLNLTLGNVKLNAHSMSGAWGEIGSRYLIRVNLYADVPPRSSGPFAFSSPSATVRQVLDAFVSTYPEYQYTQDSATGVLWIHRKKVSYEDILSRRVLVRRRALQVPMHTGIYEPLLNTLGPNVWRVASEHRHLTDPRFNSPVDLEPGLYSIRDLLNRCCTANPLQTFVFQSAGIADTLESQAFSLFCENPPTPPISAREYWRIMIAQPKSAIPSTDEISAALSDVNPRLRAAAVHYLDMTVNYNYEQDRRRDLVRTNTPEEEMQTYWALLGLRSLIANADDNAQFISAHPFVMHSLTNGLPERDPCVALLLSMELAIEHTNAAPIDVVGSHRFSAAECAVIRPDVIRIARQSELVRNRLAKIQFDDPALAPRMLTELGRTNLFSLAGGARK